MKIGIEKNKLIRLLLLKALYLFTKGNKNTWVCLKEIAETEQICNDDFISAYDFLIEEKLIKPYGAGYTVFITHEGIKKVENEIDESSILIGRV